MFQNSRNSRHFSSSKLFRQLISIPIIVYDGEGENINILSKNKIHFLPSLLYHVFKHENELKITFAPKIRIVVIVVDCCHDISHMRRRYSALSRASVFLCRKFEANLLVDLKVIQLNCIAHSYYALARAKRAHAENMHWCGFIDAKSIQ